MLLSRLIHRMANKEQERIDETCIFCFIISGQDKETTIIKENKDLVCFRDIFPAAPHHYLVVPKQHIIDCHSLHSGHISLVEQMAEMGKEVLQDEGFTDPEDLRLGFHQPPYTSVDHLHLHVLAPAREISESAMYKFIPGTYRFVTEKRLIKCLKNKVPLINDTDRRAHPDLIDELSREGLAVDFMMGSQAQGNTGNEICPFCEIVNNKTETDILLSDEELLCFRDIQPGAAHHYLVIPRTHIDNCKVLQAGHIPLVERMVEMGWAVLEQNKVSDRDDVRMGFHVPPFSSVPHLHLHALAPASQMNFKSQLHYGPQSHWFITVDKVLTQLRTRGKVR